MIVLKCFSYLDKPCMYSSQYALHLQLKAASTEIINCDQAEYFVFKPRCVFKPGCVTSTIWCQVTVTSSSVIITEQNNYRNIYRKKNTIKLKPCMYSCRDVLHPKHGLFNEVKVKLGSLFYQYFLTNNDLYNGAKIVNLPLVVVEIWFF